MVTFPPCQSMATDTIGVRVEDRKVSGIEQSQIGSLIGQSALDELFDRYTLRLAEVAELVREAGSEVAVFNSAGTSRFPELSEIKQIEIIDAMESALRIYSSAIGGGISARDNRQMAWWALRELNYRPLGDTFAHLDNRSVIEIYDQNHKQVFRTLNFFPCSSYSLDEINTFEWWELYDREPSVTQIMHQTVGHLMGHPPATILKPFPTHWVNERFSERKNSARIESKLLTPITRASSNNVAGYLNAFEVLELRKKIDN